MLDWGGGADITSGALLGLGEFAFWMAKFTFYLKIGIAICAVLLVIKVIQAARE